MFQFYWPWFALLLPLPLFVRWLLPPVKPILHKTHPELYFPNIKSIQKSFTTGSASETSKSKLPLIFLSLSWICLSLALMQPEKVDQVHHVNNIGYDLMLAVDISGSMNAVDFSTPSKVISRLDVTKDVVGTFVKGRQGDRVGLITFGESAYLQVPLTLDTMLLSKTLNHTVSGMAGNATAIGDAIGLSVKSLRTRPIGSRVLVLLTDGEDNASSIPPIEAAKLAKQYGIKVYTIAIGKNGPVPFPSQFGGYGMVEAPIDEKLLKEIADITGGQFFRATDKNALEAIYKEINELEKTESNQSISFIREPMYRYPLSLCMAFLLLLCLYQILYGRITVRGN